MINPTGNFKIPKEIKDDIYVLGDNNFQYATRDALAYVQVEKLSKLEQDKYWRNSNNDAQG